MLVNRFIQSVTVTRLWSARQTMLLLIHYPPALYCVLFKPRPAMRCLRAHPIYRTRELRAEDVAWRVFLFPIMCIF